jgi:hypothetical protein
LNLKNAVFWFVTPCGLIKNIVLKDITVIYKKFFYVPYTQAKILLKPKAGMRNTAVYTFPTYKQRQSGNVQGIL